MNVLVYGAVGVGKSLFIAECTGKEVKSGKSPEGVTKSVDQFECDEGGQHWLRFIDCPGVGDEDVPVESVLHDLNSKFANATFGAVVFVVRGDNTRFGLDGQYVTQILGLAFKDSAEWSRSTILLATHWDKVDSDEVEQNEDAIHVIARKIADMAKMPSIPEDQVILKRKGEINGILECIVRVGQGKGLIFQVPDNDDLIHAWGSVFHKESDAETVRKAYIESFQAPREANVMLNLQRSLAHERYDLLKYWLDAAKHVLVDDDRKAALEEYQVAKEQWDEDIRDVLEKIDDGQMVGPMILDLAREAPYMYDEEIKKRVFHEQKLSSS